MTDSIKVRKRYAFENVRTGERIPIQTIPSKLMKRLEKDKEFMVKQKRIRKEIGLKD